MPLDAASARFTLPAGRGASATQCPGEWSRTIDQNPQCSFARGPTGAGAEGSFTSEFGAVSMPSFESLSATLAPRHWSLHSPPMSQRNWPADGAVASFFGPAARALLNDTGAARLKTACYQSMLAQALEIKTRVAIIRSSNSWGALTWQLNEVYPTGSWGSLEYGALSQAKRGQVTGGRWRLLHYLLRREVWVDTFAACGADGHCFVRSDSLEAQDCSVTIRVLDFATGNRTTVLARPAAHLGVGAGQVERFCAGAGVGAGGGATACTPLKDVLAAAGHGGCWAGGKVGCALELSADPGSTTMQLLDTPQQQALPAATVTFAIDPTAAATGNGKADKAGGDQRPLSPVAKVTLRATATALFVMLTTTAQGRFSDNGVTLLAGEDRVIEFLQFGGGGAAETVAELRKTLRVEHLAQAQAQA